MNNPDICIDYYREPLRVGDYVIPTYKEAIDLNISGIISNIYFHKKNQQNYLTLVDDNNNVLIKDVCSRYYTTKERMDIRKEENYVYSLTCYNDEFKRINRLPLTNLTSPLYDIPDKTCYMTLDAYHLEEKGRETKKAKILTSYSYYSLFFFLVNDKLSLTYNEKNDYYTFSSPKVVFPRSTNSEYKIFNNLDELKSYIKVLIEYFNNIDLTKINNDKEFKKNKTNLQFEDDLVLKLKK